MRWLHLICSLVACHRDDKAPAPASPPPTTPAPVAPARPASTRLAAVGDRSAQLLEVDGATVKTIASAKLPSVPSALVWAAKDPMVLFAGNAMPGPDADPRYDGTVGVLTADGYAPMKPLPESTWALRQPPGATHLGPYWDLRAGNGEAWLGRCEWGGIEDGGHCDYWVWARLGGAFALTSRGEPSGDALLEWPKIAAPSGIAITFAPKDAEHPDDGSILTCRGGGKTLIYPQDEHDSPVDPKTLRWVSTDPPIFVIDEIVAGYMWTSHLVAFEGCAASTRFGEPAGFAGPDHLFALAGAEALSIRRDGKELASLPGAQKVVFAPEPREPGLFGIATLENQLAGETSMFAADAIVLGPAPVAAAGVKLVPAGVTAARVTSINSTSVGDAWWLAAEIDVTAAGTTRTYRAVELFDPKAGKVVAASFAPVKALARDASAHPVPSPTPAGPLAKLLADPRAAAAALTTSYTTVFGTDPGEHANNEESKTLLASWSKLQLSLDPQVREVHGANWGYAIGTVSLAKPGGAPYRMSAIVVGAPDKAGTWRIIALHYVAL